MPSCAHKLGNLTMTGYNSTLSNLSFEKKRDRTENTYLEKGKQWLPNSKSETVLRKSSESPSFTLSWSHYLILMRIDNPDERSFYEIECTQQQWSVRQLSRQVGSSLYERLALSRNKDEVMRLAREGQTIEKPSDIIKNPMTLEFLGLKEEEAYTESKLERKSTVGRKCATASRL